MSWADAAIAKLLAGGEAKIRPRGNSMTPRIHSGDRVTLRSAGVGDVEKGEVVLARVHGIVYLHYVLAKEEDRVQIGNARGRINGWTRTVYGKVVRG